MSIEQNAKAALHRAVVIIAVLMGVASASEANSLGVHSQKGSAVSAEFGKLFHKPVALKDQNGKAIVTRLGNPHAIVIDWNRDGKNDIVIGSQEGGKGTYDFALYFLDNKGSNREPRLQWPGLKLKKLQDGKKLTTAGCG